MSPDACVGAGGEVLVGTFTCAPNPCVINVNAEGTGDFPTIQDAIIAASDGDFVELADGIYSGPGNWNICLYGKAITIRSSSRSPVDCIIDLTQSGPAFALEHGEGPTTIIQGITMRGADVGLRGGAIRCLGSSPLFLECLILENSASPSGGAVLTTGLQAQPTFRNCVFYGNTATHGSAMWCDEAPPILENCIFAFNGSEVVRLIAGAAVSCCDVYGNLGGPSDLGPFIGPTYSTFAEDPLFCDPEAGDFYLHEDSPCAPGATYGCDLVGALPVGCHDASFTAEPTFGVAPLSVQFTDLTPGAPTRWEWDFENDGAVDDTVQHPVFEYSAPGSYSVSLRVYEGDDFLAGLVREDYVRVLGDNNMIVRPTEIVSSDPTPIPVEFAGMDSLGAISLFFEYDGTKIAYSGLETYVPGEFFSGGIVGDKISVQWFDETGGSDPIVPGVDPDTLFAILVTNVVSADSTQVQFDDAQCLLGDAVGNPIPDVQWVDEYPFGMIRINIGAVVSGRVGYYHEDDPVPGALLSMGPPNPDVVSDAQGAYEFERYPYGSYTLTIEKSEDLGGINSLDAIKVIRHSTGVEPFDDPYEEQAANVNGDGFINALDAIKIVRAAVGLEALPSGDWVFAPESYSFTPLTADETADFVAVRMGDVNGDWEPNAGRGFFAGRDSITVSFPRDTLAISNEPAQYPLLVTGFDGIGAISLRITFEDTLVEYDGVTSQVPGVSYIENLVGNEIRLEWYDPTGGADPISIGSDTLLTVGVMPVGADGDSCLFHFTDDCALGDASGDPISGVAYSDGYAFLSGGSTGVAEPPPAFAVGRNYPNPFNPRTAIQFQLPRPAVVSLRVYSLTGHCVRELVVQQRYQAGVHHAVWDGRDDAGRPVASGVYFWKIESGLGTVTRRMVLLK
jgi:hypothetical protein